jgi:hypothetical protein
MVTRTVLFPMLLLCVTLLMPESAFNSNYPLLPTVLRALI